MTNETPQTVTDWANAQFGPDLSIARIGARANLEMGELLALVTRPGSSPDKIAEECADVLIVLSRAALQMGSAVDFVVHVGAGGVLRGLPPAQREDAVYKLAMKANMHLAMFMDDIASASGFAGAALTDAWYFTCLVVHQVGLDPQQAVNAKMVINRARKWRMTGDGHGFHVKADAA